MKDDGSYYCEAHHIIPISENGTQVPENVIVLCANHHRMFHYAKNRVHVGAINDNKRVIDAIGAGVVAGIISMSLLLVIVTVIRDKRKGK